MMRTRFIALVGALLLAMPGFAFAETPDNELDAALAVKLVAMKSGVQENTIEVSFILEGTSHCKSFETTNARRVATIHGVAEEGGRSRRVVFYDFVWNADLGWFLFETGEERTGEVMFLWSEKKGRIKNK